MGQTNRPQRRAGHTVPRDTHRHLGEGSICWLAGLSAGWGPLWHPYLTQALCPFSHRLPAAWGTLLRCGHGVWGLFLGPGAPPEPRIHTGGSPPPCSEAGGSGTTAPGERRGRLEAPLAQLRSATLSQPERGPESLLPGVGAGIKWNVWSPGHLDSNCAPSMGCRPLGQKARAASVSNLKESMDIC